jgi:hypothetical protein
MYQAIRNPTSHQNTARILKEIKAKIMRLHGINKRGILMGAVEKDMLPGEEITIHQYMKSRKRRLARTVSHLTDEHGSLQTDQAEIQLIFTDHLIKKYSSRKIDVHCMHHLFNSGLSAVPLEANSALDEPVDMEEMCAAVKKGKEKKSSGCEGICAEFFTKTLDVTKQEMVEVVNYMYTDGEVTDAQKYGIIVCMPKKTHPVEFADYRTLKLSNANYKLLTRVIAHRLRPWMDDLLHPTKDCGRRGQTIFDAVASVRDIVAYSEVTKVPMCLLTIDCKEAFDRISHEYLFVVLTAYGFSERFRNRLQKICGNATSTLHMNGYRSRKIRIDSSVRQGCPLSMTLFTLCINPLIVALDKKLAGVRMGKSSTKSKVLAYADDNHTAN